VLNNVLWATSELFVRCRSPPPHLLSILQSIQTKLATSIWDLVNGGQQGISENASVAMGRMALIDNSGFNTATVIGQDVSRWFEAIGNVRDRYVTWRDSSSGAPTGHQPSPPFRSHRSRP
jgi:hypothetical protein